MKCPDDYNVVMVRFPGDVLAAVRVDDNGYPTVYINDALALQARREALKHELRHFLNGDFTNHLTIYDAERGACGTASIGVLPRAFRPVTQQELVDLSVAGHKLLVDACGPLECTEPLPMPDPMFDVPPTSWANQKVVW